MIRRALLAVALAAPLTAAAQWSTHGLTIPAEHPRLWFSNASLLAQGQAWYAANPYSPGNPLEQAMRGLLNNEQSQCDSAVATVSAYSYPTSGVSCDQCRWQGEYQITVFDWCYNMMTAGQRSTLISAINTWLPHWETAAGHGNSWGDPNMNQNNYYWGYARNELLWGIAGYGDSTTEAEAALDNVITRRLTNDFFSSTQAAADRGGATVEGTQYGQYMVGYTPIAFRSADQLGRDLYSGSNFYKESVYWHIYATTPAPSYSSNTGGSGYTLWPHGEDEDWTRSASAIGSNVLGFMGTAAIKWGDVNVGKHARQWLSMIGATASTPRYVQALDPGGSTLAFDALPLDYYASGARWFYTRNAWGPSATTIWVQAGDRAYGQGTGIALTGHTQEDFGSWQLWRNGRFLARDTVAYTESIAGKGGSGTVPARHGLAHNSLLVDGNSISNQYGTAQGVTVPRLESRPDYSFAVANLTPLRSKPNGNPAFVSLQREFVFVRALETLVIFDRVESTSASSTKTFVVHCEVPWSGSGNDSRTCTNGTQALVATTLLPASRTMGTVAEGTSYVGQNRLEIDTTPGTAQSYVLTVLQAKDATAAALTPSVVDNGTSYTVTLDGSNSVTFNKGMTSSGGSITTSSGTRALRTGAQGMSVTDAGPAWDPDTGPTLSSVSVTPASATVAQGGTQQFTCTAYYSDSSTADCTASATWTATGNATVAQGGLATGATQGSATIQAAYGGQSGSASLTVSAPSTTPTVRSGFPVTCTHASGSAPYSCTSATFSAQGGEEIAACVSTHARPVVTGSTLKWVPRAFVRSYRGDSGVQRGQTALWTARVPAGGVTGETISVSVPSVADSGGTSTPAGATLAQVFAFDAANGLGAIAWTGTVGNGASSSGTAPAQVTVKTFAPNSLVVACGAVWDGGAWSAGAGSSLVGSVYNTMGAVSRAQGASSGNLTAGTNQTASGDWEMVGFEVLPAAAPPPPKKLLCLGDSGVESSNSTSPACVQLQDLLLGRYALYGGGVWWDQSNQTQWRWLNEYANAGITWDAIWAKVGTNDTEYGLCSGVPPSAGCASGGNGHALDSTSLASLWSGLRATSASRIIVSPLVPTNANAQALAQVPAATIAADTWIRSNWPSSDPRVRLMSLNWLCDASGNPIASYIAPDGIHFSDSGNTAEAQELFSALNLIPTVSMTAQVGAVSISASSAPTIPGVSTEITVSAVGRAVSTSRTIGAVTMSGAVGAVGASGTTGVVLPVIPRSPSLGLSWVAGPWSAGYSSTTVTLAPVSMDGAVAVVAVQSTGSSVLGAVAMDGAVGGVSVAGSGAASIRPITTAVVVAGAAARGDGQGSPVAVHTTVQIGATAITGSSSQEVPPVSCEMRSGSVSAQGGGSMSAVLSGVAMDTLVADIGWTGDGTVTPAPVAMVLEPGILALVGDGEALLAPVSTLVAAGAMGSHGENNSAFAAVGMTGYVGPVTWSSDGSATLAPVVMTVAVQGVAHGFVIVPALQLRMRLDSTFDRPFVWRMVSGDAETARLTVLSSGGIQDCSSCTARLRVYRGSTTVIDRASTVAAGGLLDVTILPVDAQPAGRYYATLTVGDDSWPGSRIWQGTLDVRAAPTLPAAPAPLTPAAVAAKNLTLNADHDLDAPFFWAVPAGSAQTARLLVDVGDLPQSVAGMTAVCGTSSWAEQGVPEAGAGAFRVTLRPTDTPARGAWGMACRFTTPSWPGPRTILGTLQAR